MPLCWMKKKKLTLKHVIGEKVSTTVRADYLLHSLTRRSPAGGGLTRPKRELPVLAPAQAAHVAGQLSLPRNLLDKFLLLPLKDVAVVEAACVCRLEVDIFDGEVEKISHFNYYSEKNTK